MAHIPLTVLLPSDYDCLAVYDCTYMHIHVHIYIHTYVHTQTHFCTHLVVAPARGPVSPLLQTGITHPSCRLLRTSLFHVPTQDVFTLKPLSSRHGARGTRKNEARGLYSLIGQTSYRKISWGFEVARLDVNMIVSFYNLTDVSTAVLPRRLSNFRTIDQHKTYISWLREWTRLG